MNASHSSSMPADASTGRIESREAIPPWQRVVLIAIIFASVMMFSLVRAPMPGVDEPHYLGKGRHYWNPEWCAGDLFLESADVHVVFYQTLGWVASRLTLEQAAWIGRSVGILLLAAGWMSFATRLLPRRWSVLWALWAFLLFSAIGTLSGEFIVRGVESKLFAYAFVFLGLAFALDARWVRAGIGFGLAISFHPVVGGWSAVCASFAASVLYLRRRKHASFAGTSPGSNDPAASHTPANRMMANANAAHLAAGVIAAALCALPGLIPGLSLLGSAPPELAFQADYIQVYFRLKHHLNPMRFPLTSYAAYTVMAAGWLVLRSRAAFKPAESFFALFVVGSMGVAALGVLVGLGAEPHSEMGETARTLAAWRMRFLKFYPFRLFDVMLPIAVCLTLAAYADRWISAAASSRGGASGHARSRWAWLIFAAALVASVLIPSPERNPRKRTAIEQAAWLEACQWVAAETSPDSLFLTPIYNHTFKWYSSRPEYLTWKDCPQDARSLIEWRRRLHYIRNWLVSNNKGRYSAEAVAELRNDTGATHILAQRTGYDAWPAFEAPIVYQNEAFTVYRLDDGSSAVTEPRQ